MPLDIMEHAYTFDDVLLVPAYSSVSPTSVSTRTRLTRDLYINIPIIAAPMDTVTENKMAIAMAREGGIGIIHKNLSHVEQAEQVSTVKRHESSIVRTPISIHSHAPIVDLLHLRQKHGISGVPVVDGEQLVGIVTNRDTSFVVDHNKTVADIMTPKDKLITIRQNDDINNAANLMCQYKLERILIVDDKFRLRGLVTAKDLHKNNLFPNANLDIFQQLIVGASVSVSADIDIRVNALVSAGVDVIVVDAAHGHSLNVIEAVKFIKSSYPNIQIIAGNIVTGDAAIALIDAGADAVKVGIGPGSICTTRIISGVGVPQLTAIFNVAKHIKRCKLDIPVIADGGIRSSGDIAKAIAAGASSVMLGGLLAGTEESPGEVELFQGRTYKSYRGMGSIAAMQNSYASRYIQDKFKLVPEGIEGRVPYRGQVNAVIHQLVGGLKSAMGYIGANDISHMQQNAKFVSVTSAGIIESHVHDVEIVKETSNYNRNL
jgi:IMP dehydrogenase